MACPHQAQQLCSSIQFINLSSLFTHFLFLFSKETQSALASVIVFSLGFLLTSLDGLIFHQVLLVHPEWWRVRLLSKLSLTSLNILSLRQVLWFIYHLCGNDSQTCTPSLYLSPRVQTNIAAVTQVITNRIWTTVQKEIYIPHPLIDLFSLVSDISSQHQHQTRQKLGTNLEPSAFPDCHIQQSRISNSCMFCKFTLSSSFPVLISYLGHHHDASELRQQPLPSIIFHSI